MGTCETTVRVQSPENLLILLPQNHPHRYHGVLPYLGYVHPCPLTLFALLTPSKAYLAISIDTAGLVRVSAFWVLRKGGKYGHRLYFYLYTFFFCLGTFIGNVRFLSPPRP